MHPKIGQSVYETFFRRSYVMNYLSHQDFPFLIYFVHIFLKMKSKNSQFKVFAVKINLYVVNALFVVNVDSEEFRFGGNDRQSDIDSPDRSAATNVSMTFSVSQNSVFQNEKPEIEQHCIYKFYTIKAKPMSTIV